MSTTVRPDNLRAALDAKLAAAMSQLVELREAEQPRVTLHLNPREIVGAFLQYAGRVYPIADAFGRAQAGDLQFDAWYGQWMENARRRRSSAMEATARGACATGARAGNRADRASRFPSRRTLRSPCSSRCPARGRTFASGSFASPPPRTELRATSATTTCDWRGASRTTSSATTPGFSRGCSARNSRHAAPRRYGNEGQTRSQYRDRATTAHPRD